jgi:uncharacterized protein YegL
MKLSREDKLMAELTLEALAKRVEELERKLTEREAAPAKDWRMVAGMFTDSEFSKQVDEEALKIRQADREAARLEFGE